MDYQRFRRTLVGLKQPVSQEEAFAFVVSDEPSWG